jgi:diguanylate cyclase (GGDEF)-like protein/PAS domain S-box-containing protein
MDSEYTIAPPDETRAENLGDCEPALDAPTAAAEGLATVSTLLGELDDVVRDADARHENRLAQVRLGIAGALFASLRAKHPPTAGHSLRVALGCSAFAASLSLSDEQRDALEVAALLHDLGKIGTPDGILMKPARLTEEEADIAAKAPLAACQILQMCCADRSVLEIVRFGRAWYDGTRGGNGRCGESLPLGARMLAIVDAYDSMTSNQIYRRAMSRERAVAELFDMAGRQFDPELIQVYARLQSGGEEAFDAVVMRRWLVELAESDSSGMWHAQSQGAEAAQEASPFHERLVDQMQDGVVFADANLRITYWNAAAEQLTNVPADVAVHRNWSPDLIRLRDEGGRLIETADCPLSECLRSRARVVRRFLLSRSGGGAAMAVNASVTPVVREDGALLGVAMQLRDASSEINLEERVQSLHERATRDPLTGIANRAEFDRTLKRFVESHLEQSKPCSLIICDIDHFKRINDKHGHQAGDEALVSFASLLAGACRPGDLVARYGGEEFVMLCADCDNAAATAKAESLRKQISAVSMPMLGGASISASFGVTELQCGDNDETMLRRSDRALLQAKERGRNMVVQLGGGLSRAQDSASTGSWLKWLFGDSAPTLVERTLITAVPLEIVAEKVRGFVSDHQADVEAIDQERVLAKINAAELGQDRRKVGRSTPYMVAMHFEERRVKTVSTREGAAGGQRTLIHVTIRPKRNRDRRRSDAIQKARTIMASLQSYLMAQEYTADDGAR